MLTVAIKIPKIKPLLGQDGDHEKERDLHLLPGSLRSGSGSGGGGRWGVGGGGRGRGYSTKFCREMLRHARSPFFIYHFSPKR